MFRNARSDGTDGPSAKSRVFSGQDQLPSVVETRYTPRRPGYVHTIHDMKRDPQLAYFAFRLMPRSFCIPSRFFLICC